MTSILTRYRVLIVLCQMKAILSSFDWFILMACHTVKCYFILSCFLNVFFFPFARSFIEWLGPSWYLNVTNENSLFSHGLIEYEYFLNWSIWPIDGNLTDTTNLGQTGSESNGNEKELQTPQISKSGSESNNYEEVFPRVLELESHHQIYFSIIPRTTPFWEGYSLHILRFADRAIITCGLMSNLGCVLRFVANSYRISLDELVLVI